DEVEAKIAEVDRALNNSVLGKPIKFLFTSDQELQALKSHLETVRDVILDAYGIDTQTAIEQTGEKASQAAGGLVQLAGGADAAAASMENAQKQQEAALASIQSLSAQLEQQIATYGQGEAAVIAYRIAHGDL